MRTEPQTEAPHPDDPTQAKVSAAYREMPLPEPSAALDARILAAARQGISAANPPLPGEAAPTHRPHRHWQTLGIAASVLLGLSLSYQLMLAPQTRMNSTEGAFDTPAGDAMPSPSSMAPAPQVDQAEQAKPSELKHKKEAPPQPTETLGAASGAAAHPAPANQPLVRGITLNAMRAEPAASAAAAAPPKDAQPTPPGITPHAAPQSPAPAESAPAPALEKRASTTDTAAPARERLQKPRNDPAPVERQEAPAPAAHPSQSLNDAAKSESATPRPAPPPMLGPPTLQPSPQPAPAISPLPAPKQKAARAAAVEADAAETAPRQDARPSLQAPAAPPATATGRLAAPAEAAAGRSPEAWFAEIRALWAQGEHRRALEQLRRFRQQHPEYRLPPEWAERQ